MTKVRQLLEQYVPERYDITLTPDGETATFTGEVKITGQTTEPTNTIWLHSNGLNIVNASVNGTKAQVSDQNDHHEIELTTDESVDGDAMIEIKFKGEISPTMLGMYISNFEHDGTAKRLIATQLESNHAREMFPSIDEPAAKAVFQLTLHTVPGEQVVSNTPVETQAETDEHVITTFEPTPRMSTYLLAFVTGEMQSVQSKTKDGVEVGVWSSVAQPMQNLNYALDEAVQTLEFLEDYFGVKYPLPKCDLIALPDFDAGAMENWGCITFREIALLADAENRSISSEQYVSLVVAHELAHMWFGNLVTMRWWDDLWLNESFASIMEHITLDAIHPDWHQWEHYASMDILSTTSRDIHKDIQAISVEIDDPDTMESLFDPGIVYTKGARLLKMLIEYVGEDVFRKGMTAYFEKHQYNNATRTDLWEAITDASGKDIASLMDAWLDQSGMPMVTVSSSDAGMKVEQTRFIVDGTTDDSIWTIPLGSDSDPSFGILDEKSQDYSSGDHTVINPDGSAHFITNYDGNDLREAANEMVIGSKISASGRINYLNDLMLLSRAGFGEVVDSLKLVQQMSAEDRYSVWALMVRSIGSAQQATEGDEDAKKALQALRGDLASDWYSKLGPEDNSADDPNTIQLRSLIFSTMLAAEDDTAISEAKRMLAEAKSPQDLPSESRAVILGALVRLGDDQLAEQLIELYPKTDADMQLDIVSAVASTRNPDLAKKILDNAIGESGFVRPQDVLRWIAIMLRNHYIREVTWDKMVSEWKWLERTLRDGKAFDYLPTYCAAVVSTPEMAQKYRDLFEPLKNDKVLAHNINIGLADMETRVKWRERNEPAVKKWLAAYSSK